MGEKREKERGGEGECRGEVREEKERGGQRRRGE